MLLIDAANVFGSRPTGWWRDRAGAARQLVDRVRSAAGDSQLPRPVVMVLEGAARQGVDEGVADGVEIVHAPRAGDDTLAALAEAWGEDVVLVSADRALGDRVRHTGGTVVGPGWLFARLGPQR
jgi:rRNA-processing protein FCF1